MAVRPVLEDVRRASVRGVRARQCVDPLQSGEHANLVGTPRVRRVSPRCPRVPTCSKGVPEFDETLVRSGVRHRTLLCAAPTAWKGGERGDRGDLYVLSELCAFGNLRKTPDVVAFLR